MANNLAERSVRPLVIARKISGGSRSSTGSQIRIALFSCFGTWAAQGLNPFLQWLALLSQQTRQVKSEQFHYSGELDFLHQARTQAQRRDVQVHDGWDYFVGSWADHIAEIFHLAISPNNSHN